MAEIDAFSVPEVGSGERERVAGLYEAYLEDIERHARVLQAKAGTSYKVSEFREYKIRKSVRFVDALDDALGPLYGLTAAEVRFLKNYCWRFRRDGPVK